MFKQSLFESGVGFCVGCGDSIAFACILAASSRVSAIPRHSILLGDVADDGCVLVCNIGQVIAIVFLQNEFGDHVGRDQVLVCTDGEL